MTIDGSIRGRADVSATVVLSFVLLTLVTWVAAPAGSVEVSSLYSVETTLDPDDPSAQSGAYRSALTEVLVRVTGSMVVAESEEMAMLFSNPSRYVQQLRQGPDNTLIVSMDGSAIERTLRDAGAMVWGSDRPLTIIWLAIDWGLGDREIVNADSQDGPGGGRSFDRNGWLREQVLAVATRRGLPIVFPLLDIEDLQRIGFADIWGGFDAPLLEASSRYEADSILVGRFRPNELQTPRWTWYFGEQRFGWPGEPEEAINQLADALAARHAIRGNEVSESIELTISGIDSVIAYGRVQQYVENLRVVEKLAIRSAHPDRITYEVEVQGGAERLDNVLSLSNMLEPADNDYFIDASSKRFGNRWSNTLEYRYRPAPSSLQVDPDPFRPIQPQR